MNVNEMLVCPKCLAGLSEGLQCPSCGAQYARRHGVYDIISPELSGGQTVFWNISDEQLETGADNGQSARLADYHSRMNSETKLARSKLDGLMRGLLGGVSGTVCDLATGRGDGLQRMLESCAGGCEIVCTDVDWRILALTRKTKRTDDSRVSFVASDGRHMSLKSDSFDFVTSVAAFGNIPESGKVAGEIFRILKPGGRLIIEGSYIETGSKSYELAKLHGLEKGMVEQYLTDELRAAGFTGISSTVAAKAVWAENPYDLLPVAGDTQYFCVIQAVKPPKGKIS